VLAALEKLAADPRRPGTIKLTHRDNFWRMRAGDHRIIYLVQEKLRRILVLVVRHRREAYRDLHILEDRLIAALRRNR
jgi:mRNA interferase RelE/StbE